MHSSATAETAGQHRALHDKYRPDDHAVEQAVARHRRENPAADHAAAAIAIYDLGRELNEETRQVARGQDDDP